MDYIFRGKYGTGGDETTIGLWRTCSTSSNTEKQCYSIQCPQTGDDTTGYCSKLLAARAFVTLACIMSGISAVLLFISVATSDNGKQILLMAGRGLAFVCLIMGIIGVAIGINLATGISSNWGAAAIIGIIAIIINFCGAVASILIK